MLPAPGKRVHTAQTLDLQSSRRDSTVQTYIFQVQIVSSSSFLPRTLASVLKRQEPTPILFPDPEIQWGKCLWGA